MSTIITALITRATRLARTGRRHAGMTRPGRDLGPPGVAAPRGPVPPRRRGPARERRPRTPGGRSWRRAGAAVATAALAALALAITGSGTALAAPASPPAPPAARTAAGPPPSTPGGSSGLGVMPGTSPSIAALSDGGYRVAFQDTAGNLIVAWPGGHKDWGPAIMPGTSPAITTLFDGGYEVAFQDTSGLVDTVGTTYHEIDISLGMMAGTSPAIAAFTSASNVTDGYEVAFQANTGHLYTAGAANPYGTDQQLGMMPGTSPAIAQNREGLTDDCYVVAFQGAGNGNLWTFTSNGSSFGKDLGLGMAAGTSPAITSFADGSYQMAFQGAGNGDLWTAHSGGASQDLGLPMMPGTSPAVVQLNDGSQYQLAYQDDHGDLRSLGNDGANSYDLGMMAGTSPAITGLAYGSYQVAFQGSHGDLWTAGPGMQASPGHATGTSSAPPPAPRSSAPATPHKKPTGTPATCNSSLPYTGATWMGDLAPCLQSQTLSDIVIPGSHDSATFSLNAPLAITQDKWFSGQMNYGVRQFDLRVEAQDRGITVPDYNWYAQHGSGILDQVSSWLTLKGMFTDIAAWAKMAGHEHEHEVVLLNLQIANGTNDVAACQWFGQQMGDALVTPSQFAGSFGTTDPGHLTLKQVWSLPDPQGYARVIINNAQCTGDAHLDAGTWTPSSGYYADQCTAGGTGTGDQQYGITKLVLAAVRGRFTNSGGGEPSALNPPQPGGYYLLSIQGTPEFDCLLTPADMVTNQAEAEVLQALYNQWQTDPLTRQYLNVISADFVEDVPPLERRHRHGRSEVRHPDRPDDHRSYQRQRSGHRGVLLPGHRARSGHLLHGDRNR